MDTLKLDKSFVDTIDTSDRQYDLVRGIVQLAATLELDVVAEGIETSRHVQRLAAVDCRYGQGYHFARPLPQAALVDWLLAGTAYVEPAA